MKKLIILFAGLLFMGQAVMYAGNEELKDPEKASTPEVGSVKGRVVDAGGEVLPGASIYIEKIHTGTVSNVSGFYTLSGLKPGDYRVTVSYIGYEPQTFNVLIGKGKTAEYDIVLQEGAVLAEVEVKGAFQGQRKALNMQKNAMGVNNVVSADQVGKFPDANIGDALKRINGVNVQYDQGEARFGQVRGTSADLTSVTINGNRMPSAEDVTRNVQLDLIPADMIQTIELNKVVTSDMDGDAIGGAINLVTKNTPYRRILNFTAGSGYNWISGKLNKTLGATWGDRYFGDKLGIMAALSYQYMPGGSDNTEFEYEQDKDGKVVLKEGQVRQYYVTRQRQSYSLALDYKFNADHQISFKGLYNVRHDWENRYRISYKKLSSAAKKQSVVIQTKAGSDDQKNARLELQKTMDFTLDGEHHFGRLKTDWALSFARATEDRPNERYAAFKFTGDDIASSFVDVCDRQPYATYAIPAFTEKGWKLDELTNSDKSIVENEWKGRLNFELPLAKGLYGNKLRFGAKFVNKEKKSDKSFYSYDESLMGDWRNNLTSQVRNGFMPGSQYPLGQQFVSKSLLGKINFNPADGTEVLEEEAGNYKATERITSGYLRFDQRLGQRLDATIGLRAERTDLKTSGVNYTLTEDEKETLTPTGDFKNDYTNLLPSFLLKYKLSEEGNLRASATKTLSRPKYSALVANKSFNILDQEATIGDPYIKPTTAWNFDLSADYYFKSIGMVTVGIFYKDIKNVNVETLGYYTGEELGIKGNQDVFDVTQNLNAYDAKIFGAEFAIQRDFGFICPALRCLGFYGNYTYTHSKTNNYNERLGVKDGDNVTMAGSPEHTANASLYFEKGGVDIRLSYNFASAFVDEMNLGSRELDRYYDKVNYLDLNASYTFNLKNSAKLILFAEANNLLNQPLRYYQGQKDRTMQVEYYGVKVNAGVKINL